MTKILAVFGATGHQGGSVINYVLNDPDLFQKYRIRAITRDTSSEKAQELKERVEVIQSDMLERDSLETALTNTHTVFAITASSFGPNGFEIENNSAKTITDVAIQKDTETIIFSTLPPVKEISGGKYTKVTPFDAKARAEQYIRSLPIKSAFYCPGSFMENFEQPFMAPRQASDGTRIMTCPNSPKTPLPFIDAVSDTGKFVGAILAEPDRYEGQTFCVATALYSWEEVAAIMSKAAGKTIIHRQISLDEFKKTLPFESDIADLFVEAYSYGEEFGYFGPDSERLVAWAAENARGRLSSLEEYLETHPLLLV